MLVTNIKDLLTLQRNLIMNPPVLADGAFYGINMSDGFSFGSTWFFRLQLINLLALTVAQPQGGL